MELLKCPHCNIYIQVKNEYFNCKIFRCGIYKNNFSQINPHMKKELCEQLIKNKLIYGCGKPFKLTIKTDNSNNSIKYILEKCEYI